MTTIPAQPNDAHHHGDHGHSEYPFLRHHFDTPAQQFDSGKLGMWLFLATEVLFFGGLFVWYVVLRSQHPEIFSYAAQYLNTLLGGINTCVLILSSLTMALAVRFAQTNKRGPLVVCLFLTWLGAVGFLVIKWFEYSHKFHENLRWGEYFYQPVEDHGGGEHGAGAGHGTGAPGTTAGDGHTRAEPARPLLSFSLDATPIADPSQAGGGHAPAPAAPAPPAAPPSAGPAASGGAAAAGGATTVSTGPGVPAVEPSAIAPAASGPSGVNAGVKPIEFVEIVHGPHIPDGKHLDDATLPPNTHLFFGVYFMMTGLHAVHVIVGMIVLTWLIIGAVKGRFHSKYYTPVDLGGLYWHIVDLVWIFLFPLFYIIH